MVDSEMVKFVFSPDLEQTLDKDPTLLDQPGIKAARALPDLLVQAAQNPMAFQDPIKCRQLAGAAWECLNTSSMWGVLVMGAINAASSMTCTLTADSQDPNLYQLLISLKGLHAPVATIFYFRADQPLAVNPPTD